MASGWESGARWRPRTRPRRHPLKAVFKADLGLLAGVAALVLLGELNLLAIGESGLAFHQLLAVLVGAVLLIAARRSRSASWAWLGRCAYVIAVAMLLAVAVTGASAFGARRWLSVGSLVLQPSELAKLGLLLVLSDVLAQPWSLRRRLAAALALTAVPVALTLLQPDLSTTCLLLLVALAALTLARVPFRVIAGLAAAATVAAPLAIALLRPYQVARLNAFLHGHSDPQGAGWSELQAHIAVASGGFFGTARMPLHGLMALYLPARQTDLAFASLIQQWGLIAGCAALVAVLLVVLRLVATAWLARTASGAILSGCLAILLAGEVGISVAGNLGKAPLAGVPFPFLSYGGTAAAAHLAALGLALSARRDAQSHRLWTVGLRPRLSATAVRLAAAGLAALVASLSFFTYETQQAQAGMREMALDQMTRCGRLPAPRGIITDRHGVAVAVNDGASQVWAVPAFLLRPSLEPSRRLEALLGLQPGALEKELAGQQREILVGLGEVSPATAAKIREAGLPGVQLTPSMRRHYPYGAMLGPMLGFAGIVTAEDVDHRYLPPGSVVGRAGLEAQYDLLLRGRDGYQCVMVDPSGVPVEVAALQAPVEGGTLRLSIDLGLEREATERLWGAMQGINGQTKGSEGSAVMIDPRDGQVLAMVSEPSYDNNIFGPPVDLDALTRFYQAPGWPMLEHTTQLAVAPGSTFKLVVAAADTIYGAIPPAQVIPTGYTFSIGTTVLHGWGPLPPQRLDQAIAWSNDVYFYKLAQALGPERMAEVAFSLGAGRLTGIDLPGETAGLLGTPDSVRRSGQAWYPGTTVIMGIGQGYTTATPLEVARWTGAVATGQLVTPHLGLGRRLDRATDFVALSTGDPVTLPFAGALQPVRDGMRQAVTEGTGTMLKDIPIEAGGKTGTAEDTSNPDGSTNAWFTAAAPMSSPEVALTVLVRGGGEGHMTSEPVARDVLAYYAAHRDEIRATPPLGAPALAGEGGGRRAFA